MKYDDLCISCLRSLVLDCTNNAKSGHPGMAISSAPILYTLYTRHFVSDPSHPNWINRDRFILSSGHISALMYSLLHVAGYDVSKDDLKSFRKYGSKTPGHPEVYKTDGIDNTSGPLGQGIGQAVGVAMAETILSSIYPEGSKLFNHYTYCLCGDGCLQEGISQEAISFAGHNKLNKLIMFYDYNKITLDGTLDMSSDEDVIERFQSCHWNIIVVKDGNDIESIDKAIISAKQEKERPTVIIVHTIIGYGTPLQNSHKCHGSPIGEEMAEKAKEFYKYNYPSFEVPNEVYYTFKSTFINRGNIAFNDYLKTVEQYKIDHPEEFKYIENTINNDVSAYLIKDTDNIYLQAEATRVSFGNFLNLTANHVKNLVGGAADVASSIKTTMNDETFYSPDNRGGRNIHFGIREFLMACIQNGMLLHKGLRTYVGTFFVFSDYLKAAIRMSALSKLPAIYILTHDSIAIGEDGPTHQPIEHLAMLRSMPNLDVIRPCDGKETFAAFNLGLKSTSTPTAICLTRQKVEQIANSNAEGVEKGGYIISKEQKQVDFTIIASGSEVQLALKAQKLLLSDGIDTRIISMPSLNRFNKLSEEEKQEILGGSYEKRIFVEMGASYGLYRYSKYVMAIDTFGASGKENEVVESFGFTPEALKDKIESILNN